MIDCICPLCEKRLSVSSESVGQIIVCPKCDREIRVPRVQGGGGSTKVLIILGSIGLVIFGGCMLIVVCLAAISVLGENASARFNTVSGSIQGSGNFSKPDHP
jgi:hypothetical protein